MYSRVVRKLLINGQFTEEFDVQAGVPQGSVLSPFLYATYINGLHKALAERGLGVRVHGRLVPLLLYADDIVLLARSSSELKAMLAACHDYARKWRFNVNHGKSNVVVFGGSKLDHLEAELTEWRLEEDVLELIMEYKYLGVESGKSTGKWNTVLKRFFDNAETSLRLLMFRGGGSDGLYPSASSTLCAGLYWSMPVSSGRVASPMSGSGCWSRSSPCFAGLKGTPTAVGLRAEFEVLSLKSRRRILKPGYWRKLCDSKHSRLLSLVFRSRYAQVLAGGGQHSSPVAFRDLLQECDLEHHWLHRSAFESF